MQLSFPALVLKWGCQAYEPKAFVCARHMLCYRDRGFAIACQFWEQKIRNMSRSLLTGSSSLEFQTFCVLLRDVRHWTCDILHVKQDPLKGLLPIPQLLNHPFRKQMLTITVDSVRTQLIALIALADERTNYIVAQLSAWVGGFTFVDV